MTQAPSQGGHVPFPALNGVDCETYYKVFEDLNCGRSPVIVVHGRPGAGHEYMLPFSELWSRYQLPVIFYDQVGCGQSSRLSELDGNKSFWAFEHFVLELENLARHFKLYSALGSGYHLLGQSWGGMITPALAAKRPPGLKKLVLASGIASQQLGLDGYRLEAKQISQKDQDSIEEAARSGNYESEGYQAAMDHCQEGIHVSLESISTTRTVARLV